MCQDQKTSSRLSGLSISDNSSVRLNANDSVSRESFESLTAFWLKSPSPLRWNCLFVLPPWLETWWKELGPEGDLCLCTVKEKDRVIGIAPLLVNKGDASFVGSDDVCDCLDFVVVPGREERFFDVLLKYLIDRGVERLNLGHLRPDSTVLTHLVGLAESRGHGVSCRTEDVSLELALPTTWEDYLTSLSQKQRHELRRKLRRLGEAGKVEFRVVQESGDVSEAMDTFLELFELSTAEKAGFMNLHRESFFRSLARAMAHARLLRLGILELDEIAVAAVMCFDYDNTVHLYNSSFNPQYGSLSVGLACKILCMKDSIEKGRGKFDFLKGAEDYKYRLGGREIPLSGCEISLR